MQRFHQFIFIVALLATSWLGMMVVHEFGHVIGAWITGGTVQRLILHPLAISQTDVDPNPYPLIVVWLGPVIGSLIPVIFWLVVPKRWMSVSKILQFFAGFCLIANGAYIGFGALEGVGDCGVMLQHGSPIWMLLLFGTLCMVIGLFTWHRMGSIKPFLADASLVDPVMAYALLALLVLVVAVELSFAAM